MRIGLLWLVLGVMVALSPLAGCDQRQNAAKELQARAEKAELSLAGALKELDKVKADREEFERLLNERTEELTNVKAKWGSTQEGADRQRQQIEQLRKERDLASAAGKDVGRTTEALQAQLRDRAVQIQNLERVNRELQQTVQDLTGQVQALVQSMTSGSSGGGGADANGT